MSAQHPHPDGAAHLAILAVVVVVALVVFAVSRWRARRAAAAERQSAADDVPGESTRSPGEE